MFNTKTEVDKHVKNCLKKITNEKERNNRSYTFAKLYYNIGDYEQTKCYVNSYLSVKPKSPEGHYLLGLTLEKLGKRDAALEAYRISLQLDPKQNNLVLKADIQGIINTLCVNLPEPVCASIFLILTVSLGGRELIVKTTAIPLQLLLTKMDILRICELLADDDTSLDVVAAKYFCQLAETIDPNNQSVYNLKEKLIMNENKNPEGVIQLLLKELESRPTDVNLRVRLLRYCVQNNKIHEAYKHVYDVEERNLSIFANCSTWYDSVADVLIRYKRQASPGNLTWQFWCLFISVLDKVLRLKLDENSDNVKESSDYIGQLFLFDQSLYEACGSIEDCPDRLLSSEFVDHYRAQLLLHIATTIFKQAKKDLMQFKDAGLITLPLLFAAYHSKPIDLQGSWINHLQETQRRFVNRWHQEASFRCSQAGHTILAAASERKSTLIAKATQHSSGMWQEQLFKKVFVIREQQLKMSSSYFVTNHVQVSLKLPDKAELLSFDEESFYVLPDSLQHYVWVSLNNQLADLKYLPFQGLQYSVRNLTNCGAETLSLLDVQAFVYCAAVCAQAQLKSLKRMMYYNVDRPNVLPEAVTGQLGSTEQAKFLKAAYRMYRNEPGFDSGEIRRILIRGIETVRCVGRHGLEVALLVKLAGIFSEKANRSSKTSKVELNDARAELYWKTALPLLEKMKDNQAVMYSSNRIFEYKAKDMPLAEICSTIDKGRLFLGILAMKRKEHEKALNIFEELKDPYASFHQAHIYKQMAEHQITQNKENVTSEMRSQNVILLSKARDCFYLTLDRLRESAVDKDHPLNGELGTEIEKIERMLSRIDSDCENRNECDGMSDENGSLGDSTDHYTSANYTSQFSNVYSSPYLSRNETRVTQSTPLRFNLSRKEARPSPERLDAQFRQLVATKDATMKQVLDQNKIMLESHRCLVDELRGFKEAVYNLSGQVDNLKTMKSSLEELKDIKKSVDELKNSVDELQSFRNVADMVYELKKEIGDMRKDRTRQHQQPQLGDDLYVLDDEYPEYNIGANANFNQTYSSRIPPPAVAPPAPLYPHLYPSIYGAMAPYCYPNLGFSQSGLSFGAEQQLPPELRALVNPLASTNPVYPSQSLVQPPTIQPPLGLTGPCINPPLVPVPISTQASIFRDTRQASSVISASASSSNAPVSTLTNTKSAPVNVVITSSDPLPSLQSSVSQPVLSVTIPPQHIKGNIAKSQPHNYQIPLPTTSVASPPSVLSKPAPAITIEGMLSNVAAPIFSAIPDKKASSKNLGLQIERSLEETFSKSGTHSSKTDTSFGKVGSNEITLFECPATLNVIVGEAKELTNEGSGLFKLIETMGENKFKISMKQDMGKIIADHYVAEGLKIASKDNVFFWNAVDYSEGKQSRKTMCLKFKNADDARRFREAFEKLKQKVKGLELTSQGETPKKIEIAGNTTNQTTKTFGGFVFASSPIFKPKEEEIPQVKPEAPTEKKIESPFANFSFGVANKSDVSNNNPSLLSSISSTPPKFDDSTLPDASKSADISLTEDFVPTAEFQPVIPLPDMVEVKTGEEGAEELFNSRAKLLRFDSEKKEWKERGLGNMKILKEKAIIRLLMRREQIHKVCCNHQLLKTMNFQYMPNNFKALTWCAQDFADEVLKSETFAIRFKTEEQASDFLKCILKAQSSLNDDNSTETKEKAKEVVQISNATKGFGDKFKPVKGSWECKNCYITNDSKVNQCVACETSRPSPKKNEQVSSSKPQESKQVETKTKSVSTVKTGWGDAFKPKAGSWECQSCMVRNEGTVLHCVSCESPKDETVPKKESSNTITGVNLETPFKFTFGIGAITPTIDAGDAKPESSTFKFGSSTPVAQPKFGFGGSTAFTFQPSAAPKTEAAKTTADSFVFGSPVSHEFEFKPKPRSPRHSSGPGDEESDGSFLEEEADNIYFKPVVPLPDKVEVRTGEEDEEALYCHRAKLFRFVDGEWKERGIGDLKILKNKVNDKIRVLMRREQVLKICLNHALTSHVEYMPKDDKTWLFAAADFSEGAVSHDKFCVRFKSSEIAKEFKETVSRALDETFEPVAEKEDKAESSDGSEVEFVSETTVTPEEEKEAERLGLPSKFFAYRKLPLCECEQCALDDEYFKGTPLGEDTSVKSSSFSPKGTTVSVSTTTKSAALSTPSLFSFTTPKAETKQVSSDNSAIKTFSFTAKISELSGTPTTTPTNIFTRSVVPSSDTESNTSIFGVDLESSTTTPKNLISNSQSSSTSLFSSGNAPFSSKIFDKSAATSVGNEFTSTTPTTNLFGFSTSFTPSSTSKPFEIKTTTTPALSPSGSTTTPATSVPAATTTFSLFGSTTTSPIVNSNFTLTPSIFGAKTNAASSIFEKDQKKSTNFFGAVAKPESEKNPFGSISTGSLFGNNTGSLFGSTAKFEFGKGENIFGRKKENETTALKTTELKEGDEVVLKCESDVSFASLAQKNETVAPAFQKPADSGAVDQPFSFLGTGAPVFVRKPKQEVNVDASPNTSKGEEDDADKEGGDQEYDPHYEPIIPMPDAVVVSTGEEEETAVFNERAKLFRYDSELKEWKERGVGQMKILHHPSNGTYRILLRREQVHKIVLNQLIIPALELQPMTTSDRAWVWAGLNYVDDQSSLENLAVKFKYPETAQKFFESVQSCIVAIKERQSQHEALPTTIENYEEEEENADFEYDPAYVNNDSDSEEDDDLYGEDYEERSVMFSHACTLHELSPSGQWEKICGGIVQVYYDSEQYCSKISFSDHNGEMMSNSVIGMNTVMKLDEKECTWKTVELVNEEFEWRELRAVFDSREDANQFHINYLEGISYAQEWEIYDIIPETQVDPIE